MATSRDERYRRDPAADRFETILERTLTGYHRDELHGGADWVAERMLDETLVPIAREAFLDADDLPSDADVLRTLDEPLRLLGEGYHVLALVEPGERFVIKYAKHPDPVPPLAGASPHSKPQWERDHGVRPDGSLHPAIWQHIRAFEAYGLLVVPGRVYLAETAVDALSAGERRRIERFRSMGVVRSLGAGPRPLRVTYPEDFPDEKRADGGLQVSALVVQPRVTPLSTAIDSALRAGEVEVARDLEARYQAFTEQLWRCGVSHLDFSLLNIGIAGSASTGQLQIFDPHMGEIDVSNGARDVRDPMVNAAPGERSVDDVLRSSRDGSRWALWQVQQDVTSSDDVPLEAAVEAEAMVREFHDASEGLEAGAGSFGFEKFEQTWQQRPTHIINPVMHAQLWALMELPIARLIRSVLDPATADDVYDRTMAVLGMHEDRPLAQFQAGLKVFDGHPLIVVANIADDGSSLVQHWGRVRLPAELDVQDDPAIHYHLRDLFTGEMYVRPGDELARRGLVVGLAPHELHVLRVEDVRVEDLAVERSLAEHRDISGFVADCTKRVGVVGDVHGELQALKEILHALGFIDPLDRWCARDGTLVFTGDIGHGRHLQEVFDFVHHLAGQAHRLGGHIVWTLGNHDLYVDRDGGQGGEDSLGYRLWPDIREAALHPERHPGLTVQAVYFEHGKLFVHAGLLPNIVALALRERGAGDAETVAAYVNDVLRDTLVERERISARDLPHEIFHIGTSHTLERRMPGETGYEPAGVFTPDLREVDHYRYHDQLLPQVVGHTASRRGEIRYAPGSWTTRDYIAIDVGRQHGTGNGALLLTDFGWVSVAPGGPARLVEVSPLFVELAREASEGWHDEQGEARLGGMLSAYFQVARQERPAHGEAQEALFSDLSPAQVVSLERFLATVRQTGRSVILTDLDDMLSAFSGCTPEQGAIQALAKYLAAGGVVVFSSETAFDWFYVRLLRPLVLELGARSPALAGALLLLAGGADIFAFEDGAFRLMTREAGRDRLAGFDALVALSQTRPSDGMPPLDPAHTAYIADSTVHGRIDWPIAARAGIVVDVGDAMAGAGKEPLANLHHGYQRTVDVLLTATAALQDSGRARHPPALPEVGEPLLWTFDRRQFPAGRRLRVRVAGSGFVHAGVAGAKGAWDPIYKVPLVPVEEGGYEAVLPSGVTELTFFWTEAPWTPGRPGHWERGPRGFRSFKAVS